MSKKISIYTDSSKSPYSTIVGIAFVVVYNKEIIFKYSKACNLKSNNRGELLAIVEAMKYAEQNFTQKIVIYSDNQWCVKTINKVWKARKHLDLFQEVDLIKSIYSSDISVVWIKGHNGNKYNNLADELANEIRKKYENLLK